MLADDNSCKGLAIAKGRIQNLPYTGRDINGGKSRLLEGITLDFPYCGLAVSL